MGEAQASPGRACPERIKATVQPTAASGFQQQGVRFPAGKGQEEGGIRMAKQESARDPRGYGKKGKELELRFSNHGDMSWSPVENYRD